MLRQPRAVLHGRPPQDHHDYLARKEQRQAEQKRQPKKVGLHPRGDLCVALPPSRLPSCF
jgi:hypothetical protein